METQTIKTKIEFRAGDWNRLNSSIEANKSIMQKVWDHLDASGLPIDKVDVPQLLASPMDYLTTLMPSDFQKIAELVDKSALKFPPNIQALIAAIPGINQEIRNAEGHRWRNVFQFDKDGVTVKLEELEKLKEQCTDYCDTEAQEEAFELLSKISELLNELNQKHLRISAIYPEWTPTQNPLAKAIEFEGELFKPKTEFIKQRI